MSRLNPLDVFLTRLPKTAPNAIDSVIVLESDGDIATDARRLLQPTLAQERLHTLDATLKNDSAETATAPNLATGIDQEGRLVGVAEGRLLYESGTKLDDFIQGFVNNRQAVV